MSLFDTRGDESGRVDGLYVGISSGADVAVASPLMEGIDGTVATVRCDSGMEYPGNTESVRLHSFSWGAEFAHDVRSVNWLTPGTRALGKWVSSRRARNWSTASDHA